MGVSRSLSHQQPDQGSGIADIHALPIREGLLGVGCESLVFKEEDLHCPGDAQSLGIDLGDPEFTFHNHAVSLVDGLSLRGECRQAAIAWLWPMR